MGTLRWSWRCSSLPWYGHCRVPLPGAWPVSPPGRPLLTMDILSWLPLGPLSALNLRNYTSLAILGIATEQSVGSLSHCLEVPIGVATSSLLRPGSLAGFAETPTSAAVPGFLLKCVARLLFSAQSYSSELFVCHQLFLLRNPLFLLLLYDSYPE